MKTEFDIQLQPIDICRYNIYHVYTTASGCVAILIAIIAFSMAVGTWGEVPLHCHVCSVGQHNAALYTGQFEGEGYHENRI